MVKKNSAVKAALLTGASFAGYNIGSGFATGIEATQFFASWGPVHGFMGIGLAAVLAIITLLVIYNAGYEEHFPDSKSVYSYFFGRKLGAFFDIYVYVSLLLMALAMISGAGATINQYSGIPTIVGASIMGAVSIVVSMTGINRLKNILSYITFFIVGSIICSAIYIFVTSDITVTQGAANVDKYVDDGLLLHAAFLGLKSWYFSSLASVGLLITAGFAWASVTGSLCQSRQEAMLTGIFSSVIFYSTFIVVTYMLLVSTDFVAGQEVPLLGVIQHFMPPLAIIYSGIIIIAIFATVTGRLFSIAERYGRGKKPVEFAIVLAITIVAIVGTKFISFSLLSNFLFLFCGATGVAMGLLLIGSYIRRKLVK